MPYPWKLLNKIAPYALTIFLIVAIALGITFRFVGLNQKIYWHDEAYTTLRAAGHSSHELITEFFSKNRLTSPAEVLNYQQMKPGSTPLDTLNSLAVEDPQHSPLYFLFARGWMLIFGSSIVASRLLPVLISLISLPLIYLLAWELFQSSLTALLATALLALSPIEILFAQTARQYSLLTLMVILSSYALLKAVRWRDPLTWGMYSLACIFGLYTHLLFGLTIMAHGAYLLLLSLNAPRRFKKRTLPNFSSLFVQFLAACAIALIAVSPWLIVLAQNWQRANNSINWVNQPLSLLELIKLWFFNFTSLGIYTEWDLNNPWLYVLRFPFFIILILGIYSISEHPNKSTRWLILTLISIPFLILALPDVLLGGSRSTITRFLIPCFPGLILAVGYGFSSHIRSGKISIMDGELVWRSLLAILFTVSIISTGISTASPVGWNHYPSHKNAEIAQILNRNPSSVLMLDQGADYTNLGNILALSHHLNSQVRLFLVNSQPNLLILPIGPKIFVWNPSDQLRKTIESQKHQLKLIDSEARLWQLK